MPINKFEVVNQLCSFMQAIPALWTWQELNQQHAENEIHTEVRGPEARALHFEFQVVDKDLKESRVYLHVFVSMTESSRGMDAGRGTGYAPWTVSFLWFEDGERDMPTASEVYEGFFAELPQSR